MLKVWNVSLVIVTFFLTIFGTFMTRSGVVQSMHAFGEDKQLTWMFTAFMVLSLVVSFGLMIYRLPLLRSRNELDSWASREAAFLVNNWVLLFAAFFVLFATMFPTLSEAVRGQRLTVAAPFFNKWMAPLGLVLLLLTGIGPLLAWRKSSLVSLWNQFLWPTVATALTIAGVTWLGIEFWASGLCFGFCAFVGVTIIQEFVRGAAVRRQATGTDLFTALVGLFARSRRRYGGYVVHLGIVLVFLGFAGSGYQHKEDVPDMQPGQQVVMRPYTVVYQGLTAGDDGQKQMITATLEVTRNGKSLGQFYPARWFFHGHEGEPTTEVALRRSVADDVYLVLSSYKVETQTATISVIVNPLVNWIWLGVGVMLIGTIIALLPERAFAFATATVPERAVTTALLLVLMVTGWTAVGYAQHIVPAQTVSVAPRTPVEKELQNTIICMCGTCGRKRVGECTCNIAAGMRDEISNQLAAGQTHDQVIQYFLQKYGSQEVLAAPIDRGFNRLAWVVPYLAGLLGIVVVGSAAVRWSRGRRHVATPPPAAPPVSAALQSRLDDELRDLD